MVDKLRVVHPTPGMLVIRRVDDALFIHRCGDCPGYLLSFVELQALLQPYFEVHVLEHDYQKLIPWDGVSGNALFVCVKLG